MCPRISARALGDVARPPTPPRAPVRTSIFSVECCRAVHRPSGQSAPHPDTEAAIRRLGAHGRGDGAGSMEAYTLDLGLA